MSTIQTQNAAGGGAAGEKVKRGAASALD